MLKMKFYKIVLHSILFGFIVPVSSCMAMSQEDKAARVEAGKIIRDQRKESQKLGDFRHVIYNQDIFGKQAKKIVNFRAYGLGVLIYSFNRYTENIKGKDVVFERGEDLFGNESYTNACVDASCKDEKCKPLSFIPTSMLSKMAKK